ncbi:hypothetical protein C8Q77DRAFT_540165 [Trametes polyzona]|nr:hypothetical protein C8Q77DRAFT_540165 [Trametes polyzona]
MQGRGRCSRRVPTTSSAPMTHPRTTTSDSRHRMKHNGSNGTTVAHPRPLRVVPTTTALVSTTTTGGMVGRISTVAGAGALASSRTTAISTAPGPGKTRAGRAGGASAGSKTSRTTRRMATGRSSSGRIGLGRVGVAAGRPTGGRTPRSAHDRAPPRSLRGGAGTRTTRPSASSAASTTSGSPRPPWPTASLRRWSTAAPTRPSRTGRSLREVRPTLSPVASCKTVLTPYLQIRARLLPTSASAASTPLLPRTTETVAVPARKAAGGAQTTCGLPGTGRERHLGRSHAVRASCFCSVLASVCVIREMRVFSRLCVCSLGLCTTTSRPAIARAALDSISILRWALSVSG